MASTILTATNPRVRVLKQLKRQVLAAQAQGDGFDDGDSSDPDRPQELPPGMEQLYSYYAPSLEGGTYEITVTQHVEHHETVDGKADILTDPDPTTGVPADPVSTQIFNVNAPRFTLPPNIIHQTYPPQGLGDHCNVLPHIVFEDPHLPWEQEGSPAKDAVDTAKENTDPTNPALRARGKVPWVALFTFTEDEIKLTPQELGPKSKGGLFPEVIQVPPKVSPPPDGREQDKATFSMHLTMGEYLEMGGDLGKDANKKTITTPATVIVPILDDSIAEPIDRTQQVDVVFVPRDHLEKLIAPYDANGSPVPLPTDGKTTVTPDVSRYQWLAHVRNVNTRDMANAGLEDDGLFSVVHGHRTGPLDLTAPKPVIVHLVSLEGIESHLQLPLDETKSHVALISLYSWTYLCLPPDSVNFIDAMRDIGDQIKENECWLRAPSSIIQPMLNTVVNTATSTPQDLLRLQLGKRMQDGFVLQRYLLQTGEETVSIYRGPLTPTYVPPITDKTWPYQSNFSSDYQILDRRLGIMDISYSAAWQLGRTLGMADQAFTAALVRLRGTIQTKARRNATKDTSTPQDTVKSKAETFATLAKSVHTLGSLSSADPGVIPSDPSNRFTVTNAPVPKLALSGNTGNALPANPNTLHRKVFVSHVVNTATRLASAKDASPSGPVDDYTGEEVYVPFNDINVPNSSDWQIVQTWILSNMFLKNIPAHYLVPDPSFLTRESLKFFYIDSNWMDAFIDGALSIGNHLDRNDDVVRQAFKRNLNRYFETNYSDTHTPLQYHPQIPCFGFLLRSAVVKAFPNLEVHAPWPGHEDETETRAVTTGEPEPTLRLETLENDVLLCLFDRNPGSKYWSQPTQITISQPPHQQCFRLGGDGGVTVEDVEIEFRRLFTTTDDLPLVPVDPNHPDGKQDRYAPIQPIINWTKDNGIFGLYDDPVNPKRPITDISLPAKVFDWETRTITFPAFAKACNAVLTKEMVFQLNGTAKEYFDDDSDANGHLATAAVTGSILTSYLSQMKIEVPTPPTISTAPVPDDFIDKPRQIRLPPDSSDDPNTWQPVPVDPPAPQPAPGPPPLNPNPSLSPPAPSPTPSGVSSLWDPNLNPDIPTSEQTNIPANNPGKTLPDLIGAQFQLRVFPLGQKPPTGKLPAQTVMHPAGSDNDIPIDLVIALTPTSTATTKQDTIHNLQLFSVTVDLPVGTTASSMTAQYTGSGGKMLSNLRFNVHVSPMKDKVRFTLIPRATSRLVPLRDIPDMNFVIWQVRMNGVVDPKNGLGEVTVSVRENYRRMDSGKYYVNWANSTAILNKVMATS